MKIRSLRIENFRAIGILALENLGDTVVIAGPNGCGKTQVYHAIRLLKSTYGGYQANEYQQWWGEFQIRLDRPTREVFRIFRDPKRPLKLEADFELEPAEIGYLRDNAADLIRPRIWEQVVPGAKVGHTSSGAPIAQAHRVHGKEVERRTSDEVALVLTATSSAILSASVTVKPDLRFSFKANPGLELLFSTYAPGHLGVIDYHGAQRNYNREELGNINLNIQSSEDRFRPHMLYNWQNKYNNVKSELAAAYVRGLIAAQAGIPSDPSTSLTDTLKELFATFFPGKTFLGPTPGPSGTLDFPVRLEGGAEHDIDDLSSGEKEVLFGYLRLRNNAPTSSVVLIDEPELHLNPALLRGFPQFYHQHIGRNLRNQLWLVTHSDALLREALGQPGFSVFHMQPAGVGETTSNQIQAIEVLEQLDRAIVDLVGDLATYRPGAKVAFFEGGGDVDFDVRMTATLFPKFVEKVNAISVGSRARVEQVHDLLRRASESGRLGAHFFSVVDRDSGHVDRAADSFQWDRYHIENYLLEPKYVRAVLLDISSSGKLATSVGQASDMLLKCATETLPDLVRHELESRANSQSISAIKTRTSRDRDDIGAAVRAAVEASGSRVAEAIDKMLTLVTLSRDEATARRRFAADLKNGKWLFTFRGRDVLKRFVTHHVAGVSYEAFRDLVLARMRDDGFKPEGMRRVLDSILDAGERPNKRMQPTRSAADPQTVMPNQTNDSLEESFVSSAAKPPGRRVWKLRPESGRANWAAIFLDGELYLERVKAVPVLRQLQASGDVPPFVAVFVSSDSAVARHSDYTCDAGYGVFISEDVVPWLLSGHAEVAADRTTIVGLSLSGLAAAYTALSYPSQFCAAISQSPSFWWEDERFCSSLPEAAGSGPAFWVSVGNQETKRGVTHPPSGLIQQSSQVDACERACSALRAAQYNVNCRVFQGGHDPERWREDLALAVRWVAKSA